MKDNKLIKSGVSGVVDGENQTVGDDELELINRFTRRNLAKNEVYAFSVVHLQSDSEYFCSQNHSPVPFPLLLSAYSFR